MQSNGKYAENGQLLVSHKPKHLKDLYTVKWPHAATHLMHGPEGTGL